MFLYNSDRKLRKRFFYTYFKTSLDYVTLVSNKKGYSSKSLFNAPLENGSQLHLAKVYASTEGGRATGVGLQDTLLRTSPKPPHL